MVRGRTRGKTNRTTRKSSAKRNYPINIRSWNIHSRTVAVKKMDKSAFTNFGTGIPKGIMFYFEFKSADKKKPIVIRHDGIKYEGYLKFGRNGRTRLFWKSPFANLIKQSMPEQHQRYLENTKDKSTPIEMQFVKGSDEVYDIEFINPQITSSNLKTLGDDKAAVPKVSNFEPRPPAKSRRKGANRAKPRHSKNSKEIGDAGENVVLEAEKQKLISAGRTDLVKKIDHPAARHETPGWDISSFDETGGKIYIEVKASRGKTINGIEISRNEWNAAQNPKYRDHYHIYLVREALSTNPKIEIMKDPFGYVESGSLMAEPSTWELSLRYADQKKFRR